MAKTPEEQAFWDAAVVDIAKTLIPFGINGDVDDYGSSEIAHDASNYADALLEARRRSNAAP